METSSLIRIIGQAAEEARREGIGLHGQMQRAVSAVRRAEPDLAISTARTLVQLLWTLGVGSASSPNPG